MIGVDFGGTQIKIGEVNEAEILRTSCMPTDLRLSPEDLIRGIADGIRQFDPQPGAVGLAIPGEIDANGRCWGLTNVPGFRGIEIGALLSAELGCRVSIENDGFAAALAELLFGHGRQHPSFAILTLGTGIGGGLVIDGEPRRGSHGFAGELGHVAIGSSDDSWPACGCGHRGCVEAYASTRALLRRFEELGGKAEEPRDIANLADAGDPAAIEVFAMMGNSLGRGIATIQAILDLDAIVFSGGISHAFRHIEAPLRESLGAAAFARPLAEVPLLVSELGEFAGVVGAAHLPARQNDSAS